MAILDLFPARIRFVGPDGRLTPEAYRALNDVFERIGGATGPSTTDLAVTDDDDSGLEEFKHEAAKGLQALDLEPATVLEPYIDPMHPLATEHQQYADPFHPIHQEHARSDEPDTEIASLRERITVLEAEINNLKQGSDL
jgi:hypothetical protein